MPDWVTAPETVMKALNINVPVCIKLTCPAPPTLVAKVEPVARLSASVAPLDVTIGLHLGAAAIVPDVPLPICSVPAETVVPAYVLAAVSVVVPVPDWVTPPAPEMTPEAVNVPLCVNMTLPALATALEKFEPVARFSTSVPALAVETPLVEAIEPAVPSPISNVPAETVVAPV